MKFHIQLPPHTLADGSLTFNLIENRNVKRFRSLNANRPLPHEMIELEGCKKLDLSLSPSGAPQSSSVSYFDYEKGQRDGQTEFV